MDVRGECGNGRPRNKIEREAKKGHPTRFSHPPLHVRHRRAAHCRWGLICGDLWTIRKLGCCADFPLPPVLGGGNVGLFRCIDVSVSGMCSALRAKPQAHMIWFCKGLPLPLVQLHCQRQAIDSQWDFDWVWPTQTFRMTREQTFTDPEQLHSEPLTNPPNVFCPLSFATAWWGKGGRDR